MDQDSELPQQEARVKSIDTKRLDPNGNVIFVVQGQKRFLVSSSVLSLASPVFAALFKPYFSEGLKVATGQCPEIDLPEDEVRAMDVILSIIHHKEPDQTISARPAPTLLASIAMHGDKYDCTKVLHPWFVTWFESSLKGSVSRYGWGHLILAAHFFQNQKLFKRVTDGSLKNLTHKNLAEWERSKAMAKVIQFLPESLMQRLSSGITDFRMIVTLAIELVDDNLLENNEAFHLEKNRHQCSSCGFAFQVQKPSSSYRRGNCDKCGNPRNTVLCTVETRAVACFKILRHSRLWPPVSATQEISYNALVERTRKATAIVHNCSAGERCPLKKALSIVHTHVRMGSFKDTGLPLWPLH